jgi:hypothetical protein
MVEHANITLLYFHFLNKNERSTFVSLLVGYIATVHFSSHIVRLAHSLVVSKIVFNKLVRLQFMMFVSFFDT